MLNLQGEESEIRTRSINKVQKKLELATVSDETHKHHKNLISQDY